MPLDAATLDEVFKYHAPTEEQVGQMKEIRDRAHDLAHCILVHCPASADKTTAIRKIREAVMTANASIVLEGLV
jgi:hypothetical protein